MAKIMGNERAAAALQVTLAGATAMPAGHAPDLQKAKAVQAEAHKAGAK
jgi:hypothetical protein